LAGVYLLLNAQFIAAVQVIVYAGAIMVLFLFVIMLLNLEQEVSSQSGHLLQKVSAVVLSLLLAISLGSVMTSQVFTGQKGAYSIEKVNAVGNSEVIGRLLFTDFLLPFEITSVLLLAAMVGAVILAKKKL
jgi:NADH-quinone oxidoreductase subunit J